MKSDDHLYLDHVQMRARGWTRTLIERFLVRPDQWEAVNHYLNYKGKATYFVERVMTAERHALFETAFKASVRRRRVSQDELLSIQTERDRVNQEFHVWQQSLTPIDMKKIDAFEQIAAIFSKWRSNGIRTPHKCG